jgi:hypothetical protein
MKWTKTFSIANGTVSATGTIIDNAPTVATITPASATDLMYSTLQEQPFCSRYFVYFCSNKWYGWKCDYTTTDVIVTVPAGATTGTVSVPTTADTDGRNFQHC